MKLLISFFLFLFLFTNLYASEDKKFDFIEDKKVKEYLKDLEKNKDRQFDFIDDKKIREFLQNKNNSFEKRKEEVEFSEPVIDQHTILIFDEFIINKNWEQDEYKALEEFCDNNHYIYEVLAISFFTKQIAVKIIGI